MSKKWDAIRGSMEFYITMAVCLVVIAVSGYFLLFDGKEETPEEPAPQTEAPVTAKAPELEHEVTPPVVETVSPAEAVPAPAMPEIEWDDTPVMAEAPRPVVTPLEGDVAAAFSMDALVYNPTLDDWRTHDGVDISASLGDAVLSACAGTVLSVTEDALMGATVVIDHGDGTQCTYANLQSQPAVAKGEAVAAGQVIGAVGDGAAAEASQGPHLHFSVTRDGQPVDPEEFLAR